MLSVRVRDWRQRRLFGGVWVKRSNVNTCGRGRTLRTRLRRYSYSGLLGSGVCSWLWSWGIVKIPLKDPVLLALLEGLPPSERVMLLLFALFCTCDPSTASKSSRFSRFLTSKIVDNTLLETFNGTYSIIVTQPLYEARSSFS